MIITEPNLVMHYAPGVLAMLRREPCPGQNSAFGGTRHSTCGCDKQHHIYRIVNISIVPDHEKQGLLERSWIQHD